MAIVAVGLLLAACEKKEQKTSEVTEDIVSAEQSLDESKETKESHLAILSPENILLPSQLKGYVEVVPEDDGNLYVDFDEYNYPTLSLTLKLIKKTSAPDNQIWLVGHAQDEKGRNIDDLNPKSITSREWRSGDSDGDMIKDFLNGDVDETVTFDFTGESNIELFESDDTKIEAGKEKTREAAKKFAKFKLSITD